MTPGRPVFSSLTIAAEVPETALHTFTTLLGVDPAPVEGAAEFRIGAVRLRLETARANATGLVRAGFVSQGAESPVQTLSGLEVAFERVHPPASLPNTSAVRFDHVAVAVVNLDAACERWSRVLGGPPDERAVHPLGSFEMARFLLGDQMVELVSPLPGIPSPALRRLESHGDGPIAMALVAPDPPAAAERLESAGARVVRQPPHIFVHPRETGGVLVQLTPRLEH